MFLRALCGYARVIVGTINVTPSALSSVGSGLPNY